MLTLVGRERDGRACVVDAALKATPTKEIIADEVILHRANRMRLNAIPQIPAQRIRIRHVRFEFFDCGQAKAHTLRFKATIASAHATLLGPLRFFLQEPWAKCSFEGAQ